jgi:uncharacterized protein (TIGR02217 family)
MNFHEVRFPAALSVGSSGGPERRTEIVTLSNGFEERNSPWAHSRRRYDAGLGVRSLDDLAEVVAFFEARHGRLFGFRWKDWTDFKSCAPAAVPGALDQTLGSGNGTATTFALQKGYASGAQIYSRPIAKPVEGTVLVAVDGVGRVDGVDFSVDHEAGQLHFAVAPAAGAQVTAGFEFDVPVRFDTDRVTASLAGFAAGEIPSIPIVEVRV